MPDVADLQRSAEWNRMVSELRHRLSNNLQMMTSILNLQTSQASEPQVAAALRSAQNRVRALAGVFGLHSTPDMTALDLGSYLGWLVPELIAEYGVSDRVHPEIEASNLAVSMDDGLALALISSELIANALEHAFPDGASGRIWVNLAYSGGESATGMGELTVGDDGQQMTISCFETAETIGFTLVRALTSQLHASLKLERRPGGGKLFRLTFPLDRDEPASAS